MGKHALGRHLGVGVAAGGAITVVQCASGHAHAAPLTINYSPTNGNWLIVGIGQFQNGFGNSISVQTNLANAFTQNAYVDNTGGAGRPIQFWSLKAGAGVNSVTISNPDNDYISAAVCEVSSLVASSPKDVADTVGGVNTTPWTSGNVVTTNANDIIFGFAYAGSTSTAPTASAPWTVAIQDSDVGNGTSAVLIYRIVSSTGTYAPTGTGVAAVLGISYKGP